MINKFIAHLRTITKHMLLIRVLELSFNLFEIQIQC